MSHQRRFVVERFKEFEAAKAAERHLAKKFPENTYQTRKRRDGFVVVRRLGSKEAIESVAPETHRRETNAKRRARRKRVTPIL